MDERQQRGLEIAATKKITRNGEMWVVPSQAGKSRYGVTINKEGKFCTCPDYEERQQPCKHVHAVEFVIKRETVLIDEHTTITTETAAVKITYSQDWAAYNAAQTTEKAAFLKLFRALCSNVEEPVQTNGRPRLSRADMIFACGFKVYSGLSGRRFMTDLRDAHGEGMLTRLPHYNSLFNYLEDEALTPIIQEMVTASALPLRALETDFAIDSTGFTSTQLVGSWQSEKYGSKAPRVEHDWLKVHAVAGCRTNAIVAVEIGPRNSADCTYFESLLATTAQHFNVQRILGDKAYSTHANVAFAESKGIAPVIPFKAYSVGTTPNETWNKLFHFFSFHRDEFLKVYHQRSNIESTFSAVKRKFGDYVRSKDKTAQVNELLLKFVAYNIVCCVHAMHEMGITQVV